MNYGGIELTGDKHDVDFLKKNADCIRSRALHLPHLDQPISLINYVRIANDIESRLRSVTAKKTAGEHLNPRVLDWGCGYGQMTWLLKRRGFNITSFDIGHDDAVLPDIPLCHALQVTRTTHPTQLPFQKETFEAVLSCGVLEHVDECSGELGNERKSLAEIARVLTPNGRFLIYQLPQKAAWQEAVVRRLKLGYSHPRRYSAAEIERLLTEAGFRMVRLKRANLIPKNLTGMPNAIRKIYSVFGPALVLLDGFLCRIPLLNRIAGALEIEAVKA